MKGTQGAWMLVGWVGAAVVALILIAAAIWAYNWFTGWRTASAVEGIDVAHEQVSRVALPEQTIAVLQEKTVMVPVIGHSQLADTATHAEFDEAFSFIYWERDLAFEDALVRFGLEGDELAALVAVSAAGRECAVTGEIAAVAA